MHRIGLGVRVGIVFAAILSAYVIVTYGFSGRNSVDAFGLGVRGIVGIYVLGGIAGGLIVDVFGSSVQSKLAAAGVGFLAGSPLCLGFAVAGSLPGTPDAPALGGAVLTSLVVGGASGVYFYEFNRRS